MAEIIDKVDLRVVKNNQLLINAFIKLLERKSFDDISVVEICNEAKVSRSAFYDHFKDKYDLFSYSVNVMLGELMNENTIYLSHSKIVLEKIEKYLNFIEENKIDYKAIKLNNKGNILETIFLSIYEGLVNINCEDLSVDVPKRIYLEFVVAGVAALCDEFLTGKLDCSKEELLNYLEVLLQNKK